MTRREFGVLGVAGAALAGFNQVAHGQEKKEAPPGHEQHFQAMLDCAKACADCALECESCSAHCLHHVLGGHKEHAVTLKACRDCADVCAAAAQIVARFGPYSMQICDSCAEVCNLCAQECEKFPDDAKMKKCAQQCRACEKACRDMKKHAAAAN